MTKTYRAVQVTAPGKLELVEKPLQDPPPGHVRVRVEACGVCHSDAATVLTQWPIQLPRVPGHEAVGRIDAVGVGVQRWRVGQRVGVGFLGGACGHCDACRRGDLVGCQDQAFTGIHLDGGWAESMIAKASALVSVPDKLRSVDAAPLLCAGLTTFRALRDSPARAGDLVAVVGIGGLGHLAVQYARHMGFEVVAVGRGREKAALAAELGAHHYLDSTAGDPGEALRALGGASLVVDTASGGKTLAAAAKGLRSGGAVIVVGATTEPIDVSSLDLIFFNREIRGSLTGDPGTADATLRFSALTEIVPTIETVPLEDAPAAYAKMMAGKARFRMVLTM